MIVAAVVAALVVVAITIGVITERNDATSATPPAATTTEPGGSGSATEAPSTRASSTTPAPSEPALATTLTADNSREFAKVLKADNECDERIDNFARKNAGETVEFPGIILSLAQHGETRTRFDILISPGNSVETTRGPLFRYGDVNTTSDLGWAGENLPDTVAKGSKLLFTAEVGDYDTDRCLLSMSPGRHPNQVTRTRLPRPPQVVTPVSGLSLGRAPHDGRLLKYALNSGWLNSALGSQHERQSRSAVCGATAKSASKTSIAWVNT